MGLQRKTAFVVEDHPRLRGAIRKLLLQMGLEVVEAADGVSAMDRLAGLRPDLILLDLVLPESSGYDLCEFIRSSPAHSDLPLLVMSERSSPADRAHAAEVGATAFLAKPFHDDDLRAWVAALLGDADQDRLRASGEP